MKKKKVIILGGNPETGAIVDVANKIGLHTIVIDPYPNSPAKKTAVTTYEIDVTDVQLINKIVKKENVDGVLLGVADPLTPYYEKICRENNFPCYATEKIIEYLSSKSKFSQLCLQFGIRPIPQFNSDKKNTDLAYPIVIKPVDSGAGVGISICHHPNEVEDAIKKALSASIRKEYLIEKYMECDDIFAYYTFIDGQAYLSALADRYKTKKQGQFSSVCIAAEYPSKHANRFKNEIHPKLLLMFKELGISNGVLLIQFFVDNENFYAYDPGFRLQGEGPHIYLKHFNGFDQREMLLNFSLSGSMYDGNFNEKNDPLFKGKHACTLWILLKEGTIGKISGLNEVKSHPSVINILQRFFTNDSVTESMLGTERQVFCRIYIVSDNNKDIKETIKYVNDSLSILNVHGDSMILDSWDNNYEQ